MLGFLHLTKSEKIKLEQLIEILKEDEQVSYQLLEVLNLNSEELIELIKLIFDNLDEMYETSIVSPTKLERKLFEYKNVYYIVEKKYFKSTITYTLRKKFDNERIKRINIIG